MRDDDAWCMPSSGVPSNGVPLRSAHACCMRLACIVHTIGTQAKGVPSGSEFKYTGFEGSERNVEEFRGRVEPPK